MRHHGAADGPDYLWFAGMDWWYHSHAHADFQLAMNMARHRRVLLVNSIGMRVPVPGRTNLIGRRVANKLRSVGKLLRQPVPELPDFHVMTPVSVPVSGSDRLRALNAGSVRWQVEGAMRYLGMTEPLAVAVLPTARDVARGMSLRGLVYNRYDKHSTFEDTDQALIRRLEDELLAHADAVTYVSHRLMEEDAQRIGGRAVFLDHGVDLELFQPVEASRWPQDIRAIPGPRLGFFGGIRDFAIDLSLLEQVADQLPDASVVLVGDATCDQVRFRRLLDRPNVHWLGTRPFEAIPAYGSAFDVALMPMVYNDFTAYQNPIKMKEYLALGLPVVSTDFGEARMYEDLITVAATRDEFVAGIRSTLADPGRGRDLRRAAVAGATWEVRAKEMIDVAEGR